MTDMLEPRGRKLAVSLPRRWIGDLLHFARKVPGVMVQREMNLAPLVQARLRAARRISWCALFTRAYALTAAETPELRRAYIPFPWPHFYEHPRSVASVAVERVYQGERAVFFAHLLAPETQTLEMLDDHLRAYKEQPVESFGIFRRALRVSRLPRPLRRLLWWVGLNSSGYKRARRMGTFGVSVYSGLGAESFNHLTPLTSTFNYGVIGGDGRVAVRILYDHRVMDGGTVARALERLERVLNQDIARELGGGAPARAA
jgi:hypothetical protein